MQVFVSNKGYISLYPMKSKGDLKVCFKFFCKAIGVPDTLVLDNSGEKTSNLVKLFSNQAGLKLQTLEEST